MSNDSFIEKVNFVKITDQGDIREVVAVFKNDSAKNSFESEVEKSMDPELTALPAGNLKNEKSKPKITKASKSSRFDRFKYVGVIGFEKQKDCINDKYDKMIENLTPESRPKARARAPGRARVPQAFDHQPSEADLFHLSKKYQHDVYKINLARAKELDDFELEWHIESQEFWRPAQNPNNLDTENLTVQPSASKKISKSKSTDLRENSENMPVDENRLNNSPEIKNQAGDLATPSPASKKIENIVTEPQPPVQPTPSLSNDSSFVLDESLDEKIKSCKSFAILLTCECIYFIISRTGCSIFWKEI